MQGETDALPSSLSSVLPSFRLSARKSHRLRRSPKTKKPFEPSWQKESTRSSALHFRPPLKVLVTIASVRPSVRSAHLRLPRSAKVGAPGLVRFIPAVAYHFSLNLPAAFTPPGAQFFADLCAVFQKLPPDINSAGPNGPLNAILPSRRHYGRAHQPITLIPGLSLPPNCFPNLGE